MPGAAITRGDADEMVDELEMFILARDLGAALEWTSKIRSAMYSLISPDPASESSEGKIYIVNHDIADILASVERRISDDIAALRAKSDVEVQKLRILGVPIDKG